MLSTKTPLEVEQTLPTLYDDTVTISANGKPLVLYFFAPWCQVCHASISNLQSIYEKNENLDVIAVALDFTDKNEVMKFSQQHQLTFPIALGNSQFKELLQVQGYPSYYIVDEENLIASKSMGYSTELGMYLRSL